MEDSAAVRPSGRRLPEILNVPWGMGDLVLFVVGWIGIQVVVLIVLTLVGMDVPAIGHFVTSATKGDVGPAFALDLMDAAVGFGLVWAFLRKYKVGWQAAGWRRINVGKAIAYLVLVLMGFIVAATSVLALVAWLVPSFNANQAQSNEFTSGASQHFSLALVALVLLPPFLEETIFRGFIFPAIAKRAGVIWGAVLSSAIFGLAHLQANISVYTFILGLVLCFMYVKLKSIVPGIFLHMLNNYLALLALTHK